MKYIITSYVAHGILLFLSLYAIGCCGFHILPAWRVSENYESINNTFLSIALSYVAGLVIYVLTSVLPRQQRENEVFTLWKPHLDKLYNEMSERIEEVRAFVGIDKDKMGALTVEDCKPLERYTDLPAEVWLYKKTKDYQLDNPYVVKVPYSIKKVLNGHNKSVHHVIDVMLNNPAAVNAENRILDILSQIRASSFLSCCTRIEDSSQLRNSQIRICHSELPKPFCEYVKLRDKLGTMSINKNVYDMRVMTDEEVREDRKIADNLVAQQGYTMEQIREFGQKIINASK